MKNNRKNNQQNQKKQSIKETKDDIQNNTIKDKSLANEIGGRKGPEPTRYGDWEKNGRCIDF